MFYKYSQTSGAPSILPAQDSVLTALVALLEQIQTPELSLAKQKIKSLYFA